MNCSDTPGAAAGRFLKYAAAVWVVWFVLLPPAPANALELLLGTDRAGSFSHYAGRTLCRMIEGELEGITCRSVPAEGDVHNLTNVRIGSLDLALVDSRMLHDAIHRSGNFRFLDIRYDNLRSLSELYEIPVTLVARSDARIDALGDLKGRRVNAGAPRTAEQMAFETVLEAKAWSRGDFSLVEELSSSQSLDTLAFCHGTIQAMLHIGVHPNETLRQLLRLCDARMRDLYDSDVADVVGRHPALFRVEIPAGTYPTQKDPVSTFGTRAVLVASQDFGVEKVYRIVAAIHRLRKRLAGAHPALAPFPEDAPPSNAIGIPPHPGAVRYFSDRSS